MPDIAEAFWATGVDERVWVAFGCLLDIQVVASFVAEPRTSRFLQIKERQGVGFGVGDNKKFGSLDQ